MILNVLSSLFQAAQMHVIEHISHWLVFGSRRHVNFSIV